MAGENIVDSGAVQLLPGFEKFPSKLPQVQNSSSFLVVLIGGTALIIVILVVGMLIKWIAKVQKYNRLRHYLIPVYSYDPNEEENCDVDILIQESTVFNYKSQEIRKIITWVSEAIHSDELISSYLNGDRDASLIGIDDQQVIISLSNMRKIHRINHDS